MGWIVELFWAGATLLLAFGIGTIAHELSHALALRALGIRCDFELFPRGARMGFDIALGAVASVTPRGIGPDLAPWRLRVAALMPLTLAVPIPLVLAGVLPDPIAAGDPALTAATAAWLACAIPSPQDFSLVWHAEAAIERYAGG